MARPRKFDEDTVLESALIVFWEYGYEGASLTKLLEATGLTKSSLYGAFGNKEALFYKVVERYQRNYLEFSLEAFSQSTSRAIVERLLLGMANLHTSQNTPNGCLGINGALACSPESEPIRESLSIGRTLMRKNLRDRFVETGSVLPSGMNPDSAAFYVATLIHGMAVQARSGATRQDLLDLVNSTLSTWPEE